MKTWVTLLIAIVAETVATSALKASNGFTKLLPSVLVVVGYGTAFYCLSIALRTIQVGTAYAIWSGIGIILVTLVGVVLYKQVPDVATLIGMGLIVAGVIVINLFGKPVGH
ncbi:multidrug efflux SMR transporter [Hymenobacter sp. BT507]|uniref:Multidrug efflux SMR transporter n=1 Tax=Hymenobacter citatus TaxID=2763506 RepID=A0ABR7MPS4_9BACT|nr:multidrug efflux SMR transporter [Hymenobacter citatus]MBC6613080.1 multidrug efflux SMR transporter [Hymenobacter citatus]